MAGFSLWRLLNQRQPFDGNHDMDPAQQRQAAGQAIGQSLIDMWNRADPNAAGAGTDEDSDPYLSHLIDYPDAPGRSSIKPELLPYYPSGGQSYGLVLDSALGAGNSLPDPSEPLSEGQTGGPADPNIHLAQAQVVPFAVRAGAAALAAATAAAAEWSRQHPAGGQWKGTPPPPDQPYAPSFAGSDPSATAASPAFPDAEDVPDELKGPEIDPRGELDPLAQIYARTIYQKRHDALQRMRIEDAAARGCDVIAEVPFGIWNNSRPPGRADILSRCPPDDATAEEVKVAKRWRLSDAQKDMYPAMEEGRSYSPDLRITQLGLVPNTRLGPIKVIRAFKRPDRPDVDVRPMFPDFPLP
jgi:hypothetical protein